ncbi:MAG: hypothetical protein WC319_00905 [Candidatus Paceibacterota bacterium]|jgi:hypothetical protein
MTLFVRHPIRNIGKVNSYERQVDKFKNSKKSQKSTQEKKNIKDVKKTID